MEGVSPIKIDVLKTGPQGSILLDYPVELRKDSLSHQPSCLVSTWNLNDSPMFHHPMVFPNVWSPNYLVDQVPNNQNIGIRDLIIETFFVFFLGEKVLRKKSFNDGWKMATAHPKGQLCGIYWIYGGQFGDILWGFIVPSQTRIFKWSRDIYINIHSYTCMSIVYSVHICNHVYMYIIMYMYAYIGIDVCAHAPSLHQPTIGTPGDDLQALVV